MRVLSLSPRLKKYLRERNLLKKFEKQIHLFEKNLRHKSLHVELLEPHKRGIYSFRIDRKYRVLFIFRDDVSAIEILAITSHYQ